MKIKKVEIQAFKSYLLPEDGIFNFTRTDDNINPTNFCSIYAPNGFGKTSFYDAIDYCITNNIGRYIRAKVKNNNQKDAKEQNEKGEKQYILRNRNADDVNSKLETKINIYTTSREQPLTSNYKPARNGSMDYQFDHSKRNPDTEYIENVLLSQEAIDSFLRESNAAERYNKFIQNTRVC